MKKGCMMLLTALMMLVSGTALAGLGKELQSGFTMPPPPQVKAHVERNFPLYTLEDYLELTGTPKGDYGFALLKAGDERVLLGYEKKDGEMRYWLKNAGAVPQGGKGGWFAYSPRGETIYGEEFKTSLSDGLSFQVIVSEGESYDRYTAYHWEDGGFKLTGYKDLDEFYGDVDVANGVLHFSNWLEGRDFGKVYGTVQRDLRYVSFGALPKTVEEAKKQLTRAPELRHDGLNSVPNMDVKEVQFTGGRTYPVYQGPGKPYGRAAGGKASVSTNDWIQVFCRYNGYVMIQYDISAEQYRVGWIDEGALPKGANVSEVDLQLAREDQTTLSYACALTDDPYNSGRQIAWLEAGTPMLEVIYNLYGWSYVRVHVDGQTICGFVPSDAPNHG